MVFIINHILNAAYFIILIVACIIAIKRFRSVDQPTKLLCLWIWLGGATEVMALYFMFRFKNNLSVYSVYNLLELCLITLYFTYSVKYIKKYKIGFTIIIIGLLLWVGNLIFLQPINKIGSNFIFFECLTIVCLCLYSIYRRLVIDNGSLMPKTHFWIPSIFILYQIGVLWSWGFYDYFFEIDPESTSILMLSILGINVLTYIGFAFILLLYPKMKRSYVF